MFLHLTLSVLLLPCWALLHFLPCSPSPKSWSIHETILINFMRFISYLVPICNLSLGVIDRETLPLPGTMKLTRAIWIPPLRDELLMSILKSNHVKPKRCPGFVWGTGSKDVGEIRVGKGENIILLFNGGGFTTGNSTEGNTLLTFCEFYLKSERLTLLSCLILYASALPLKLLSQSKIQHILSVDYRKVCHDPFPAQIQDAVSAYFYLVETVKVKPSQIFLAGYSAGGNLVLALARYLREGGWDLPNGILLFSPWVCMVDYFGPRSYLRPLADPGVDYITSFTVSSHMSHSPYF